MTPACLLKTTLFLATLTSAWSPIATAADEKSVPIIKLQRESDLSKYPRYEIRNTTTAPLTITLASSLETTDGTLYQQATTTHTLAPGHIDTYPAYAPSPTDSRIALRNDIALLRTTITLTPDTLPSSLPRIQKPTPPSSAPRVPLPGTAITSSA